MMKLRSHAEFVLVSKEVSTLENEMLEFKESLSEWKGMPSLLHIDDTASVAGAYFKRWKSSHAITCCFRASKKRPVLHRRFTRLVREPDANASYTD